MKLPESSETANTNAGLVRSFSASEVAEKNTPADCWAIIESQVYDLTSWVSRHPGGARPITDLCGIDGTERFVNVHGGSNSARAALILLKIGDLNQ